MDFSGERSKNVPAFKAPRKCPQVLLVEVRLRTGKDLGSEEVNFITNRENEF